MAVVFILLDAFRWDYLDANITPFLAFCANEGVYINRVIPNFGFCERSEILTGKTPDVTGYFTAIGYDAESSPFKNLKFLMAFNLFECLLPKNRYYKFYRAKLSKFLKRYSQGMSIYNIPFSFLPYFSLTEDQYDHRTPEAFPVPSILEHIESAGESYYYDSFTALNLPSNGTDNNRLNMALEAAEDSHLLYLVYISLPDGLGHKYGPLSAQLMDGLRQMDSSLEAFVKQFESKREGSQYIFLGDHGMVPVVEYVDIEKQLFAEAKRLKFKIRKDYIYFLDSTLCRVWFFNDNAKQDLRQALINNSVFKKYGLFINQNVATREHIPWNDRRYGNLIWWANPGVLVFPDFFHRGEKLKGMHGYNPNIPESQGMCIVYSKNENHVEREKMKLTDAYNIIMERLSL